MSRNLISLLFIIVQSVTINFGKDYFLDTEEDWENSYDNWMHDCEYYRDEDDICETEGDGLIPQGEYRHNKGFLSACVGVKDPPTCSLVLNSTTDLDITKVGILAYIKSPGVTLSVSSTDGREQDFNIMADGWTDIDNFINVSTLSPIRQIRITMEYNSRASFSVLDQVSAMGDNIDTPSTETSVVDTTTKKTQLPTAITEKVLSTTGGWTASTTTTRPLTSTTPTATTTTTSTTISSTITKNTPPGRCQECRATDSEDYTWTACAGELNIRDCSEVVRDSTGQITWECLNDGQFHTDGPNYEGCKSTWLIDLVDDSHSINDTRSALDYLIKLQKQMSQSQNASYFGHEMRTINEILGNLIKTVSTFPGDVVSFGDVANVTMAVAGHLITTQKPWYHLNLNNRSQLATNLFQTIEQTSFLLTSKVSVSGSYELGLFSEIHFTVTSLAFSKSFSGLDTFQYPRRGTQDSVIKLPSGWARYVKGEKIECIGMFMDPIYASLIMPGQFNKLGLESNENPKKVLNGQIMSFTIASHSIKPSGFSGNEKIQIDNTDFEFEGQGVQITFKHVLEAWGDESYDIPRKRRSGEKSKAAQGTAQCVFWDTEILHWSPKGCKLVTSTESETICECNHLTSFAILMDMHNYVDKNQGLEVLTLILSTISIICLIFTILIINLIKFVKNKRTLITMHLAICLVLGNLMVLLVLDKDYLNLPNEACIASGIAIHYIFLAAFAWMGFQGIHLYRMVVNVFNFEKPRFSIIMLLCYGGPLFIIAITSIIGYLLEGKLPYGGELICWLNGPYIFAFMGPVLIIVLANVAILSLSSWKTHRIRNRSTGVSSVSLAGTRRRVSSLRSCIQGSLALTMLLGITWLSGYLMLAPAIPGIIAAYFFTILNASQGIFIFLFDCFFNDKVRQGVHRQYGQYLPVRLGNWLKTTSTALSPETTDTSGKAMSRIQKNDVSRMSSSNSDDNSLRQVPPPRQRQMVGTSTAAKLPQPPQSLHSPIPRPRPRYGIDGGAIKTKPNKWEGRL